MRIRVQFRYNAETGEVELIEMDDVGASTRVEDHESHDGIASPQAPLVTGRASAEVVGEARLRQEFGTQLGNPVRRAFEDALGADSRWTRVDGTYRLELEDGWVGYDPETGVIELVTRLSDVVTVEATAARMVSGTVDAEESAEHTERYYEDSWSGPGKSAERTVREMQERAEQEARRRLEESAQQRREELSRRAAERLDESRELLRPVHEMLALAYRDTLVEYARSRGVAEVSEEETDGVLEVVPEYASAREERRSSDPDTAAPQAGDVSNSAGDPVGFTSPVFHGRVAGAQFAWHPARETDASSPEERRLVAELAEQAAPSRDVPLHVQVVVGRNEGNKGVSLRPFAIPPEGARLHITVHAPGLVALGDLQQELTVYPGRDSDVVRFGLRTAATGLHRVTARAFRGGTFLGEVHCQISVEDGGPTRDGRTQTALLPSMAFEPGEVTLQVLEKDRRAGTFTFQLLSANCHPPEVFSFRAGDPREATRQIFDELKRAAKAAADGDRSVHPSKLRRRLRSHGVQLWTSAVPEAVQHQFWEEVDRITAFTVLGEQDIVPWELMYPLNEGREDSGFLAEWLPVVRRVFDQERVGSLTLPNAAFVVPPDSPPDAHNEVDALRASLGAGVVDAGVLTEGEALRELIEEGYAGLLHFACHNSFSGAGSRVRMADGAFDPIDLAAAAQLRSLRPYGPLVFFNACRSAGEIDWFGASLGWAPQFLQAGAGAFVGTLWPVRSRSALMFADAFYRQLVVDKQPLGQASLAARKAISDQDGDPTWLAYAVYGSPAATAHTTTPGTTGVKNS
ncbi:CHAT domain-containing protein [Streptomyces sp. NPDC002928]|uniref:CHAT domain-containing protein n=1 Tax=Streptomyces sp. NPDC002928 TaxID=3154440 RepID=UPI0033AB560B